MTPGTARRASPTDYWQLTTGNYSHVPTLSVDRTERRRALLLERLAARHAAGRRRHRGRRRGAQLSQTRRNGPRSFDRRRHSPGAVLGAGCRADRRLARYAGQFATARPTRGVGRRMRPHATRRPSGRFFRSMVHITAAHNRRPAEPACVPNKLALQPAFPHSLNHHVE